MARRNGNGEGSRPRKRPDGRWEARYWAETPIGRKRRSVYGSSRKEVADKLVEAMTTKENTPVVMPMNITVGEFLNRHLEVAKETLKKRTWENHDDTVRVHLTPMLGHLKLKELSREHIQYLYTTKRGEGLSAGTVRRIHAVLSSAFSRAVRWRLVTHNICQDVDPPRPEPSEIRPLNQKEARNFLGAEGERYHALYCLALTSGMRRGEILGLRWGSLDLTKRTLQVRHALVAGRGAPTFDSPKTNKSRRSLTLTAKAVDALVQHRERQCEAGFSVENDALVFTSTKGTPTNTSRLRLAFKAFLKRTGLPDIRFQDLRHTYATLLLSKGIHPKIVSEQLGHANIGITLDTYSHVLPGMGDAAAGAMDEALE